VRSARSARLNQMVVWPVDVYTTDHGLDTPAGPDAPSASASSDAVFNFDYDVDVGYAQGGHRYVVHVAGGLEPFATRDLAGAHCRSGIKSSDTVKGGGRGEGALKVKETGSEEDKERRGVSAEEEEEVVVVPEEVVVLPGKVLFTSRLPAAQLVQELHAAEKLSLFVWSCPTPTMDEAAMKGAHSSADWLAKFVQVVEQGLNRISMVKVETAWRAAVGHEPPTATNGRNASAGDVSNGSGDISGDGSGGSVSLSFRASVKRTGQKSRGVVTSVAMERALGDIVHRLTGVRTGSRF